MPASVGIDLVSSWCGVDLSSYPIDGPLPPLPDVSSYDGWRTNLERLKEFAQENLTIGEIARRISNAGTGPVMAGTPQEIADEMEAWYAAGAADGFNLMFPLLPDDWVNFAEYVVPELQRRGLTPNSMLAVPCVTSSASPGRRTSLATCDRDGRAGRGPSTKGSQHDRINPPIAG